MPIGDRETFAEIFEHWVNNGDIDGFNAEFTLFQIVI
jgi:hypothetical protein